MANLGNEGFTHTKGVVLVTGSCGLIGSTLVKRLGSEFRMIGFELLKAFYASANEELVPCDLTSEESVHQAFTHIRHFYGNTIKAVIHLAAYYSFNNQDDELYNKITVEGTKRLLRHLRGFNVGQFIFSSTMLVHAPCQPGEKINESWPIHPRWAYPKSKIKTEEIIKQERGQIPTVILRIAGVYDNECHSIPLAHQIQRIFEHQVNAHLFAGNIDHGSDFMHMNDLVDAIVHCIHYKEQLPEEITLLIGEGKTLSYDYIQRRISSLLFNKEIQTHALPKTLAKVGAWVENLSPLKQEQFIKPWMIDVADDHYELDISRAKELLHWEPKHSLDKTFPLMINSLKHDPIAWYKKNHLHIPSSIKKRIEEEHLAHK